MNKPFITGVNYWASDQAIYMWRNFNIDIIKRDFQAISDLGMDTIRVFPLWPDFQPIQMLKGYVGHDREICYTDGTSLPATPEGRVGIDVQQIEHLRALLDAAQACNLKVILALLTGWMSARMFVPPALEGKNLITDSMAVKWEIKYVQYLVRHMKDHPAIYGWDLGNECNCLQGGTSAEQNYVWEATISNTIKAEDQTRPIISGMNCDAPYGGSWSIHDQAEVLDILCTHPYPFFTPYAMLDDSLSMRTFMMSSARSALHADLSGKSCLVEEIGTLGPMHSSYDNMAKFLRVNLFESLAMGYQGYLVWCAFDQEHLTYKPYDWEACERELGLMLPDYTLLPHAREFKRLNEVIRQQELLNLAPAKKRAVCILSHNQDTWCVAYAAWILARQAGLLLQFITVEDALPDAELYMLPSVKGSNAMSGHFYKELVARVDQGAALYLSMGEKAFLSRFTDLVGAEIQSVRQESTRVKLTLDGETIPLNASYQYHFKATTAQVLSAAEDGSPLFFKNRFGKGTVYTLAAPVEEWTGRTSGSLSDEDAPRFDLIYKQVAAPMLDRNQVSKTNRYLAVSEHVDVSQMVVIAINCTDSPLSDTLTVQSGWKLDKVIYGLALTQSEWKIHMDLPPAEAAILHFIKI